MRSRLAIPMLALTLLSALGRSTPAQTPKCGVERWPVKVLLDPGAATLKREAEATTITALTGMPKETDRPQNGRASLERRVFRVRGIILEQRPIQADGDVHLVLGDPADTTRFLVAEIPDSACAVGSRYASDFAEARRTFVGMPVGVEVEVEGVAFWDDEHGQLGAAPNDIELHPVLKIVPVLNRNDLLRTELGADPVVAQDIRVWLNTASKVYHCPGSANFGTTSRGEYMTESAAVRAGARPAGGKRCA
ncbi:MAG: hypothetical protein IPP98_06795 [Gemmatimonadetes bacterium]|nr:hypothetical protein [Gemmatimonadota bacterium]